MKTKTPSKEKKVNEPQKGFEEFAIDPAVLEELDNIEEDSNDNNQESTPVNEQKDETELEVIDSEIQILDEKLKKQALVTPSNDEFINIVKENIGFCAKEIKDVSATMDKIESQKGTESFWKKGENIKTISKYVNKMADVQQKTLDLLVMFLGASGKMAEDYDTILQTIDELGEVNGGEAEVLNYLLKIKKMVKEIKNNDERLKAIVFDVNNLKDKVKELEENYNGKIVVYEKETKINTSKINRLRVRLNNQSFFILISFILIIILAIFFYVKVIK